ncbi:hypothetical protein CBOM_07528 [Ceraceosorus bombacis]|uniref:Uncharacterized protein n=1 Tax=Ceraceosorus bombacis TaxID=401625 RepID=A0A0P1BEP1_9BASI|nr:hypothetical protein CBOM_07528 [Ceraceosorus bombacis]
MRESRLNKRDTSARLRMMHRSPEATGWPPSCHLSRMGDRRRERTLAVHATAVYLFYVGAFRAAISIRSARLLIERHDIWR